MVGLWGLAFAVYVDMVPNASAWQTAWSVIGVFAAIGCGISMVWRIKYPWLIFLINAGAALILPLDPFGTLITLSWVMATAPVARLRLAVGLAALVTGVVCGVRVEDITDPVIRKIRYLDKLVDELAKGKAMEKILRS